MGSRPQHILVVGGAGYVGSMVVRHLLDEGYDVRVFDSLIYGDIGLCGILDKVDLRVGDMCTMTSAHFDGIDAVINLGGISNDPTAEYDPDATFAVNRDAAIRLAAMCREHGIRRHILASSCSVYDVGCADEHADALQDETADLNPIHPYSLSKYEAERGILALSGNDFCPIVLRKGTVYGFSPRMRYDLVVNTFVRCAVASGCLKLFSGGETWRPLADIRDVAAAYETCLRLDEDEVRGQIFNVASANVRISELGLRVRATLEQLGVATTLEPTWDSPPQRSYRVSTSKARAVLRAECSRPMHDAVEEMLERIRSGAFGDFDNPRYYNLRWLEHLKSTR